MANNKKNNEQKTEKTERQEKRSADIIAVEKINRSMKIVSKQIEILDKAKKNIIKSGNVDIAKKYNKALEIYSDEFVCLKVDVSKMGTVQKEETKSFDIMDIVVEDETEE